MLHGTPKWVSVLENARQGSSLPHACPNIDRFHSKGRFPVFRVWPPDDFRGVKFKLTDFVKPNLGSLGEPERLPTIWRPPSAPDLIVNLEVQAKEPGEILNDVRLSKFNSLPSSASISAELSLAHPHILIAWRAGTQHLPIAIK